MSQPLTVTLPAEQDEAARLKRENAQLRAYLRAFVRATYQHPESCYGGDTPAQDATSMHRVNPGFAYSFGLKELEGPDPVITGGQVMRAMELLGEAEELPPAEEAKNLQAGALLRGVHSTVVMAAETLRGLKGQSTLEAVLRSAAGNSANDRTAEALEARADRVKTTLIHLENMAVAIPATLAHTPGLLSQAEHDVLAERRRQVDEEGWTPEHDDRQEREGQMAGAAACYAFGERLWTGVENGVGFLREAATVWPWSNEWWKPSTRRRNLVKAGALILAELEREDRAAAKAAAQPAGNEA